MIWFTSGHGDEDLRIAVGFQRPDFDRALDEKGSVSVVASDLGFRFGVLMVTLPGTADRVRERIGADMLVGCIELTADDLDRLRSGAACRRTLVQAGIDRSGSIDLFVAVDDEALLAAFVAAGIVTDRSQVGGLLSPEEREALRAKLVEVANRPSPIEVREIASFPRRSRPWWKFWG